MAEKNSEWSFGFGHIHPILVCKVIINPFISCCIIKVMTRRTVITRIRKHRAQLEKLGVKSLSLFGSVARREERPDSDVDILVEFRGKATFDRYMDTKFYLEDLLGCKVDLVTPKAIKPRMKPYIMQDLVHVA